VFHDGFVPLRLDVVPETAFVGPGVPSASWSRPWLGPLRSPGGQALMALRSWRHLIEKSAHPSVRDKLGEEAVTLSLAPH
jgi:hypothetical protein